MKNEKLMRSIGDVADQYIKEAAPQKKTADNPQLSSSKRGIQRYLPIAACIAIFLFGTTAFAATYIQNNISSFYLRYLWPEDMAVADSIAEHYGAKVYFDGLKSDDWFNQYFAINKLVEYYNDEEVRLEAIRAITPFLTNDEEKIADAAAFSLSILTKAFDDPRLIHLADGSIVFTLFNNYSDYGSYNQLWQLKDGELSECMRLTPPHMYIKHIIPSPDHKLIAIVTCSGRSEYIWIDDLINGFVSAELIDSARILVAKDMGYAVSQRIDFENYSGLVVDLVPDPDGILRWGDGRSSIYWVNNSTLEFMANLHGEVEEIEIFNATATVRYDFQKKHMDYNLITD